MAQAFSRCPDISPPTLHNLQAEQALLGAILVNNEAGHRVSGFLLPEHFFEGVHQRIYEAAADLIRSGRKADPITLKARFEQDMALSEIGGTFYLARLVAEATTLLNAEEYGRIIYELATRRQTIATCEAAMARAADATEDFRAALSETIDELTGVFDGARQRQTCFTLAESTTKAIERLSRLRAGEPDPNAVKTRIPALDAMTGGLHRGEYVVIGARPSMGKTAFAVQLAMNVAEAGGGVAYFSLEMPEALLSPRFIASKLWSPNRQEGTYQALLNGQISEIEAGYARDASDEMKSWPILIEDEPGLTAAEIEARARVIDSKLRTKQKTLDLVIVDHIHKCRHPGAQSKVSELTEISARLAEAAKRLNCPVIALAQLNRGVESREEKRPTLADLRESGAIEQDADLVAFIYREAYYLERQSFGSNYDREADRMAELMRCQNKMELIIAKQRSGPIGSVDLWANMGCNKVLDMSEAPL